MSNFFRSIACAFLLLAPVLAAVTSAGTAQQAFEEHWEPIPTGWRLTEGQGIAKDCASHLGTGCHVKVDPPCCPNHHTHYQMDLDAALDQTITAEFLYAGSKLGGETDAVFQIRLDVGWINVELTGGASNNRVEMFLSDGTLRAAGTWSQPNTLYRLRAVIEPASGGVHLELRTLAGELIGATPAGAIPAGATRVTDVSIQGARWNPDDGVHRFDDVVLRRGNVEILNETWDPAIVGWTTRGTPRIDCEIGHPGCSLQLAPTAASAVAVERSIPMAAASLTVVEFWYRWDGEGLHADSVVQVRMDWGSFNIGMTGGRYNDVAELVVPGLPKMAIGTVPRETWVRVVAEIDTFLHVVSADLYLENGRRIGSSLPLPIQLGATRVSGLLIHAEEWETSSLDFHFDAIRIRAGA